MAGALVPLAGFIETLDLGEHFQPAYGTDLISREDLWVKEESLRQTRVGSLRFSTSLLQFKLVDSAGVIQPVTWREILHWIDLASLQAPNIRITATLHSIDAIDPAALTVAGRLHAAELATFEVLSSTLAVWLLHATQLYHLSMRLVTIHDVYQAPVFKFAQILSATVHTVELHYCRLSVQTVGDLLSNPGTVQTLRLTELIYPRSLPTLICGPLRELYLGDSVDIGWIRQALSQGAQLRSLRLGYCSITRAVLADAVALLQSLPYLEVLDIRVDLESFDNTDQYTLCTALSACQSLHEIILNVSTGASGPHQIDPLMTCIGYLPALRSLNIDGPSWLPWTGPALSSLMDGLGLVRQMNDLSVRVGDNEALLAVLQGLPRLTSLRTLVLRGASLQTFPAANFHAALAASSDLLHAVVPAPSKNIRILMARRARLYDMQQRFLILIMAERRRNTMAQNATRGGLPPRLWEHIFREFNEVFKKK